MSGADETSLLDIAAQLIKLRDLTERTGAVHEAQAFQLKAWRWVLFPESTEASCQIEVDVEGKIVTYPFTGKLAIPFNLKERGDFLTKGIHFLFGETWIIRVTNEGRVIYPLPHGKRKRSPARRRRARKPRSKA